VNSDAKALAVDIGGTKLAVGAVTADGRLVHQHREPTLRTDDPWALFGQLRAMVQTMSALHEFSVCGVGCGGPMAPMGEQVSPLNIGAWRGFPLRKQLAELTGLPTFVENDAKALALAEGWVGAAQGRRNYLAMVVSTGIGGGIILDGRLLQGDSSNAGHIGHMVVAVPGRELDGHVAGVLEAEASGTAIAAHTGRPPANARPEEIDEVGRLVGQAAGSVVNLLDLPLVVVAGSVALGYGARFFAAAQREIDRVCQLDFSRGARIMPAGCGAQGPLIGAGAVGFAYLGLPLGMVEVR